MNTRAFTSLVALAAVLGAGCAQDRSSLELQMTCFPTDDCSFTETCDAQFIGVFQLLSNAATPPPLWIFMQVANQLPNNGDPDVGRVNTNDAHVTGATLELSGGLSGTFTVDPVTNQIVQAGGTSVIGLRANIGGFLTTDGMVVHGLLRLTGYYDNGREFETGEYNVDFEAHDSLGACASGTVAACPGNPDPSVGASTTIFQEPSVCVTP